MRFAICLSLWQLLFSIPPVLREQCSDAKGIFDSHLEPGLKRRTVVIILMTGMIFGLSTFLYVLCVEKAGAVSAAIAMQAYPVFAILWETLFLKRGKTILELILTFLLILALYYLGTGGTWQIAGLNAWFILALGVPFLWSIAHIIIKEVLDRTPITPFQVIFFRVLVSTVFLACVALVVSDNNQLVKDMLNTNFQKFALLMGLVYYLELVVWFFAVRSISVSLASSITTPWPALTLVLAVIFLGEQIKGYQLISLCVVALSVYGLIFTSVQNARPKIASSASDTDAHTAQAPDRSPP